MIEQRHIILFALFYGPILKQFPEPTGPYAVGTTSYHWVDKKRKELHKKNSQEPRELMVCCWYPSDGKNETLFPHRPNKIAEFKKINKKYFPYIPSFMWDRLLIEQTYAIPDAPISNKLEKYPVLIFSPRYGCSPDDYSILCSDLASHGYIVVGVDHPYISRLVIFPDKRIVILGDSEVLDPNISWEERKNIIKDDIICKEDIEFVLHKLTTINNQEEKSAFYKKIDINRIGVFGHSLGGMASIQATCNNNQIKVCVDLDGWNATIMTPEKFEKPFFGLFGNYRPEPTEEELKENKTSIEEYKKWWNATQTSLESFCQNSGKYCYQIILNNVSHMDFCDMILTKKPMAQLEGLVLGPTKPYNTIKIINAYTRTFFDKYLKDIDQYFGQF